MIKRLLEYCNTSKNFIFENSFSLYELLTKVIEKLNETIDFVNGFESDIQDLDKRKEDSSNITTSRQLSETGDFTGTVHKRTALSLINMIDDNGDKLFYLTQQFSDGQTGFVVDGGFFTDTGIKDNYNGGVF